jgi:lipopolysaccharide/colanic/teichoic acid biosynthesis glycosyltransferase
VNSRSAIGGALKRGVDIAASAVSLVLLAPVMLSVALAIRLSSNGPILFRQQRMGRGFRPFTILKFRSMTHGSEGPAITVGGDARVTDLGRFLRYTKLDELPQLINVLRGDMSLVGPRPELARYVELFKQEYAEILSVRPGITDFASFQYRDEEQILARSADPEREYSEVILPIKVELGKRYVRRAGLGFDLGIILKTALGLVWHRTNRIRSTLLNVRRPIVVIIHLSMAALSYYFAWWFRFDGRIPAHEQHVLLQMLPVVLGARAASLYYFRLYQGLWRFTDIWDVERIFLGVLVGQALVVGIVRVGFGASDFPRAVFVLDAMLFMFSMVAARLIWRGYIGLGQFEPNLRTLIVGPHASAALLAHALRTNSVSDRLVVGLVDTHRDHLGLHIHGVPVIGSVSDLPDALHKAAPDEILVVGLDDMTSRLVDTAAAAYGVSVRQAPDLTLVLSDPSLKEPKPVRLSVPEDKATETMTPERKTIPDLTPESQSVRSASRQRCQHCGEFSARRTRAASFWERVRRVVSSKHLFRCESCRRRFWSDILPPRVQPLSTPAVDLTDLDKDLDRAPYRTSREQ